MRSQMVGALAQTHSRPESHLRAHDLRKGFGDGAVLDGVSLTVTAGQRLAVIGDNGVGKSTLLRLLAGKLAPDGGEVRCTTESRSLVEQEMDAPAGATVGSVRAEALRSPRDALSALSVAASGLAAGAEARRRPLRSRARPRRAACRMGCRTATRRRRSTPSTRISPEQALASLSVGQRYRLRLGCALANPAGAVLLDEPSNHLDDISLDRLVQWLLEFPGIAVFVTHDRWLLDAVATAIFDLDPALDAGGTLFGGSFPAYREARAGTLREWRRRYTASLDAEHKLSKQLIAARATAPGHWQPGKGAAKHGRESRAASSVRLLQRRIDQLRSERGPAPPNPLTFTAPDAADTGDATLLKATGIAVQGRVTQPSDSPVRLGARGRLLVRGANGAGKSTLLSVLARQLAPDAGTLTTAPGIKVGLLTQEDDWHPNRTPAEELAAWDLDQIRATGLLRDADLDHPLGQLSVGQRRRVTLARILLSQPSVLLLDEPTNHLSVTLIDELSAALLSTPAAVVLVTHDRTLRRMVHDWPTMTLLPATARAGAP